MIPNPLAIFGELRTQAKSIKTRCEKYQVGPDVFKSLTDKLRLLLDHIEEIERLRQQYPNALPSGDGTLFQEKLRHVRQTFKNEHATICSMMTKAFDGSLHGKALRLFLANTLNDKMTDLMAKINTGTNQLENLVNSFLMALKHEEVISKLDKVSDHVTPRSETRANHEEFMSKLYKVGERVTPRSENRANHEAVTSMVMEAGDQAEANHDEVMSKLYKMGEHVTPRSETRANHESVTSMVVDVDERAREDHEAVMSKLDKVGEHVTPRPVIEQNHGEVISKLDNVDENVTQLKNLCETSKEDYHPFYNTPTPSDTVVLDFSPTTSLGKLKQSVLYGKSSEIVTAATGAIEETSTGTRNPAFGVVGMAGVGKTVALQAIGHDEDVKKRFRDGVLYMTFGKEADKQTAIDQIAHIMTLTGATSTVKEVRRSTFLKDAVDYAVMWFGGKFCLYLIDDLWPAQHLPLGYFQDLRQLLRGSPNSRMAISTRSHSIAHDAGYAVEFSPGGKHGKASVDIFMKHARQLSSQNSGAAREGLRPSVSTILSICSGLPIALSVAGCAVSELVELYGTFEKACDEYAAELVTKEAGVGSGLNAGILLSLKYLEVEFAKLVTERSLQINHSISDLYTSLCVLSNQARIPLSVLSRLWNLSLPAARTIAMLFRKMSLAKVQPSSGSGEEPGLVLHDLHLDFCQAQAEATNKLSFWHARLLNGYWESSIGEECHTPVACTILSCVPRPWWCIVDVKEGYIHTNLARHLSCAGRGVELAALLLDARWTELRGRIGGLLALESDFEHLRRYLSQWDGSKEVEACIREVEQSFENIFRVVRFSWGRLSEGMRAFQFQICGRLQSSREWNASVEDYLKEPKSIADAYLKSAVMTTPKPYLLPMRCFLVRGSSALITEIPVGGECASAASSSCGEYIAAGAGDDIVIAKARTGEVLGRTYGHTENVTCVKFAGGSKKIVSGGRDGKVILWEWESSSSPVRVLQREKPISGLGVHKNVFFSSGRNLEVWDISKREESRKLYTHDYADLTCLDVCGKNGKVAFCAPLGRLMVWDIDATGVVFEDNKQYVTCGAFSPNGQYLATGSWCTFIDLWDVSAEPRRVKSFSAHGGDVISVAFRPDGMKIVSGLDDGTIRVWDVECGECNGISERISSSIRRACLSVSFTSDGKRIISGSADGFLRIWDACLETEAKECNMKLAKAVRDVLISRNGLRVATASRDGAVRLWNTETGEQIGVPLAVRPDEEYCVALSPDGRKLVAGSNGFLEQWNTETCTRIGDFDGYYNPRRVAFSCDGRRIIYGNSVFQIRIWNAEPDDKFGSVSECVDQNENFRYLFLWNDLISCVAESDDGSHVVSRDELRRTVIRSRETLQFVWHSESSERKSDSFIKDDEAEKIIRSCGPYVPRLWPLSFSPYIDELYCEKGRVYTNLLDGRTMIAEADEPWEYNSERKVFGFGLDSGDVAICKLIVE